MASSGFSFMADSNDDVYLEYNLFLLKLWFNIIVFMTIVFSSDSTFFSNFSFTLVAHV